jgi:hypothetical protein
MLEAGPDLFPCSFLTFDTLHLGNNVQISNGIPPYNYSWTLEKHNNIGGNTWTTYASDYLDDTTSANPTLLSGYTDTLQFYLTVTDSMGQQCIDSLRLIPAVFLGHLTIINPVINKGDSIFLNYVPNLQGGIAPVQYVWRPNHGLRDSTKPAGFWAKPDHSISYYLSATDASGCTATATPLYHITVNHLDIKEANLVEKITVFPNPADSRLNIRYSDGMDVKEVVIINSLGEKIYTSKSQIETLGLSGLDSGMYVLMFQTKLGVVNKKFIVQ